MEFSPTSQQQDLLLDDEAYGAAHLAATHGVGPDQLGGTIRPAEVDLRLAITENVDVRRPVVVGEDHDA